MNVGLGSPGLVADERDGPGVGEGEGLFFRRIDRSGISKLPLRSEEPANAQQAISIGRPLI